MAHRNGTSLLEPRARRTSDVRRMSLDALIDLADHLEGAPIPGVTMTESEFVDWCPEPLRAEWIDGRIILMSPANVDHDDLTIFFIRLLGEYVESHDLGSIYQNVFVRFPSQRRRRVPDLMFIAKARADIIHPRCIEGPPDLLIEIVSPDSQSRDRREKYLDYQKAGVREYWIVDPLSKTVEVARLERKRYHPVEEKSGVIASTVLPGFRIKTAQLWLKPLPKVSSVMRWMNRK
jgi:Uma2 family endonuclease